MPGSIGELLEVGDLVDVRAEIVEIRRTPGEPVIIKVKTETHVMSRMAAKLTFAVNPDSVRLAVRGVKL